MSTKVVKLCSMLPSEWTNMSSRCSSNQKYHCLQNDYRQLVDGCFQAMWVEAGRCPVYNSVAAKLDSVLCNGDECPTKFYRSNELYKFSACFPKPNQRGEGEITNTSLLLNSTVGDGIDRNNKEITGPIVGSVLAILLCLLLFLFLYRYWEYFSKKKQNKDEPEMVDLIKQKTSLTDFNATSDKMYPLYCCTSIITSLKRNGLISIVSNWHFARSHMIDKMMEELNTGLTNKRLIISTSDISEYESIQGDMKLGPIVHFKDFVHEWHSVEHVQKINRSIRKIQGNWIKKEEKPSDKRKTKEKHTLRTYVILTITATAWRTFQHIFKDCVAFSNERRHLVQLTEGEKDKFVDLCLSSCEFPSSKICLFKDSLKKQPRDVQEYHIACRKFMFTKNLQLPLKSVADDLQGMMCSKDVYEHKKFVLLANLMMKGGYVTLDDINPGFYKITDIRMKLKTVILGKSKHGFPPLPLEYIEVGEEGNSYRIEHEEVERILFWSVAQHNLDVLIEHCNEQLLIKCVRPCAKRDDNDHDYAVYVDTKYYAALAKRFARIEKEIVLSHALYSDENFRTIIDDSLFEERVKQEE